MRASPLTGTCSSRQMHSLFRSGAAAHTRPFGTSRRSVAVKAAATLIDGKETAATIRKEIAAEVAELKAKTGKVCVLPCEFTWHMMMACTCSQAFLVRTCCVHSCVLLPVNNIELFLML